MLAAIEHVHHRHRHHARARVEIAIERHAGRRGGGVGGGERNAEHRVGAELGLVFGAVERDQPLVERALRGCVGAAKRVRDGPVDVGDGASHALAAEAARVAVAQFQRLVNAGRGARRHGGAAERAAVQLHVDLNRGIAARIDNFAGANFSNVGCGH